MNNTIDIQNKVFTVATDSLIIIEFITLYIHTKPIEERLEAGAEAEKRLNNSQLSLFDNMTEK